MCVVAIATFQTIRIGNTRATDTHGCFHFLQWAVRVVTPSAAIHQSSGFVDRGIQSKIPTLVPQANAPMNPWTNVVRIMLFRAVWNGEITDPLRPPKQSFATGFSKCDAAIVVVGRKKRDGHVCNVSC